MKFWHFPQKVKRIPSLTRFPLNNNHAAIGMLHRLLMDDIQRHSDPRRFLCARGRHKPFGGLSRSSRWLNLLWNAVDTHKSAEGSEHFVVVEITQKNNLFPFKWWLSPLDRMKLHRNCHSISEMLRLRMVSCKSFTVIVERQLWRSGWPLFENPPEIVQTVWTFPLSCSRKRTENSECSHRENHKPVLRWGLKRCGSRHCQQCPHRATTGVGERNV